MVLCNHSSLQDWINMLLIIHIDIYTCIYVYIYMYIGSSLQDWIENMLFTLQDSIEQHVQAAMNDST
jgi:hypothetical protein